MSVQFYICNSKLHRCQWCSKFIYRGNKMLQFNGFSYDSVSRFVDSIIKQNGAVPFENQDIINKIMGYIVDDNVLDLSVKPWLNKKYIHHDCGAAEIMHQRTS